MTGYSFRLVWIGMLAFIGLSAALSQTGGCGGADCPEPEPFLSGNYEIVGLAYGQVGPDQQRLLDTVTGAAVSVDRESRVVTITYTKEGATYEVRYMIKETR
jgi:hypothetical protein